MLKLALLVRSPLRYAGLNVRKSPSISELRDAALLLLSGWPGDVLTIAVPTLDMADPSFYQI